VVLTDKEIQALKPQVKRYKIFDGDGLYLLVHPNGGKYWYLKYHFSARPQEVSFGPYPAVRLKLARERRVQWGRCAPESRRSEPVGRLLGCARAPDAISRCCRQDGIGEEGQRAADHDFFFPSAPAIDANRTGSKPGTSGQSRGTCSH
jgi:Arm DNA-binding domain